MVDPKIIMKLTSSSNLQADQKCLYIGEKLANLADVFNDFKNVDEATGGVT